MPADQPNNADIVRAYIHSSTGDLPTPVVQRLEQTVGGPGVLFVLKVEKDIVANGVGALMTKTWVIELATFRSSTKTLLTICAPRLNILQHGVVLIENIKLDHGVTAGIAQIKYVIVSH